MTIKADSVNWDKIDGLLPCIAQDQDTGKVLMLGYVNKDALNETLKSKKLTFWSRTKKRLWCKGETSGNFLEVSDLYLDCDQDALLALVTPHGPTCHLGTQSCFGDEAEPLASFPVELSKLVRERNEQRPKGSYTTTLFESGLNKIAQKVGEEGVETVVAALGETNERVSEEAADLLFHLMVMLEAKGMNYQDVLAVLKARHGS